MKNLLLLILLLIFSCGNNFVPTGNFYTCSESDYYEELYFKDDSVKYSNKNGVISKWQKFKIVKDTFFYLTPESKAPTTAIISIKNQDQFTLMYRTGVKLDFYRITDESIDVENNENLKNGIKKRFSQSICE